MKTTPNCKINLGLHIVEKRPDGYHNIETVFYPVTLCDELEIVAANDFTFAQNGIQLECRVSDNLCVKAYNLLQKDYHDAMGSVAMNLKKNIPFGAGLGGGSADAAFTLTMLNNMFGLNLDADTLQQYAGKLGADCAFFIKNIPVYATQKGDVFEDIDISLKGYVLLLVKPDIFISTPEAYAGVTPKKPNVNLKDALQQPIEEWRHTIVNDFEDSVFPKYPLLAELKKMMYDKGALYAAMSGSGSTMFGIFPKESSVDIKDFDSKGFIWKTELF